MNATFENAENKTSSLRYVIIIVAGGTVPFLVYFLQLPFLKHVVFSSARHVHAWKPTKL